VLSAYDDLIENNTRRIAILEEMAQAIYREWFVNFRFPGHEKVKLINSPLGKIPEGWKIGRLDDVLVLQRGFDLPVGQRLEGNVPVYAATGIVGTHNEAKVKGPGVLTGRSGSLGTVTYIHEDHWLLNTALWVKEFKKPSPIFAFYTLRSINFSSFNSGAAVPTLNRNDIHGLPTLLPADDIVVAFHQVECPLFDAVRTLRKKNEVLRTTRDLLLPKLMSGQLDVEELDIDTGEPLVEATT
jgi:type I restriction enzyme S subunit